MRRIKKFMMTEETHKDSNCFALTVICHGNDRGHLLDRNKKRAWITEDIVGDLSEVDNLRGKPKLFVVQACRGSKHHAFKLLLPPATKSRQGNVITPVCQSFCSQGVSVSACTTGHMTGGLCPGGSLSSGSLSGALCPGGLSLRTLRTITRGWYASYSNAFLFQNNFSCSTQDIILIFLN